MIRTDCVRNGRLLVENMDSVTKEIYDKWSERIHLKAGDIVFTREAPMGESAIIPDDGNSYFPGQRIVTIRSKGNVSTLFINYLIYANEFRREIRIRDSAATTVANFGIPSIKNYVAQLPCVKEQRKIGKYFHQLDNLITLHQRKLDQLKTLKKYFLQNMLPAKGEKVPRIRFKGFTGDWEQRKLGELVEFYNGDRSSRYPNDSDMVSEGIPFINAGDLVSGRVKLDTANKITEEKFNELSGAKIQRGDIIYCLRGTLGKNAFVDNFDVGTVASSLVDIRPKKVVGKYLYQVLNSDIEYTQRIVNDEGAAQPNLSAKNLSLFNIPMPDEVEQEKITAYFDDLDNLITLHQRKLNQLLTMKKFMLQNLFI